MKKREKKYDGILQLLAQGKSNTEIASILGFALITIKKDITTLFKQYNVKNRTELACEYVAEKLANY